MMNRRSVFAGLFALVGGVIGRRSAVAEQVVAGMVVPGVVYSGDKWNPENDSKSIAAPIGWRYRRRLTVTNNSSLSESPMWVSYVLPSDSSYVAGEDLLVLQDDNAPVQWQYGHEWEGQTTVSFLIDALEPGEARHFQILYGRVDEDGQYRRIPSNTSTTLTNHRGRWRINEFQGVPVTMFLIADTERDDGQ